MYALREGIGKVCIMLFCTYINPLTFRKVFRILFFRWLGYEENLYIAAIREVLRQAFNPLAPKDVYISRTAQLTSRCCILNIYSTNILTEYFKHAAHSPFFFSLSSRCLLLHTANFFGSCHVHILNTGRAKNLKKIPEPKG